MEYCKHCTASFYVCSGHLSHQADSVSHCAFCGGSLGSRTEEKSKRHRGKGQVGGRERQSRSRTLEGNGCLVSRILRLSLRSTGLPHTVRRLPHVLTFLSARKTKVISAQIQQALNQTGRSHRAEGFCLGSLHKSLFRFRLERQCSFCRPNVNADAGTRGCWRVSGGAPRPCSSGFASPWKGGAPPHTTPRRLYPQHGP